MAQNSVLEMAAKIVASYVSANTISPDALSDLIGATYGALTGVGGVRLVPRRRSREKKTAALVKRSLTSDYLVCLEDGGRYRSLKRHLRVKYGMTPDDYRAKWGLPWDYPMVAPAYAAYRSAMAKQVGLGRMPRSTTAAHGQRTVQAEG